MTKRCKFNHLASEGHHVPLKLPMMPDRAGKKTTSMRLSKRCRDLLDWFSRRHNISQSEVIEILTRQAYEDEIKSDAKSEDGPKN